MYYRLDSYGVWIYSHCGENPGSRTACRTRGSCRSSIRLPKTDLGCETMTESAEDFRLTTGSFDRKPRFTNGVTERN